MQYELKDEDISRIKKQIKIIKEKILIWEEERSKALADRKKYPDKYYKSITERIKFAEHQIEKYKQLLTEMESICKSKSIQI